VGDKTRYVACVVQLVDDERIVEDRYCDVAARPASSRTCWSADCPQHITVPPSTTTAVVTADDRRRPTYSTAHWRTGTWGSVRSAFTARRIRNAVYAMTRSPSVCLSVTRRYCVETAQRIDLIFNTLAKLVLFYTVW